MEEVKARIYNASLKLRKTLVKFWFFTMRNITFQVQVQNFIQKTFSGYTQVAYEKKEEQ